MAMPCNQVIDYSPNKKFQYWMIVYGIEIGKYRTCHVCNDRNIGKFWQYTVLRTSESESILAIRIHIGWYLN